MIATGMGADTGTLKMMTPFITNPLSVKPPIKAGVLVHCLERLYPSSPAIPWQSGSIADAEETLRLYQLEFVIELKNAVGAATIDNFFLWTPLNKVYLPITSKAS